LAALHLLNANPASIEQRVDVTISYIPLALLGYLCTRIQNRFLSYFTIVWAAYLLLIAFLTSNKLFSITIASNYPAAYVYVSYALSGLMGSSLLLFIVALLRSVPGQLSLRRNIVELTISGAIGLLIAVSLNLGDRVGGTLFPWVVLNSMFLVPILFRYRLIIKHLLLGFDDFGMRITLSLMMMFSIVLGWTQLSYWTADILTQHIGVTLVGAILAAIMAIALLKRWNSVQLVGSLGLVLLYFVTSMSLNLPLGEGFVMALIGAMMSLALILTSVAGVQWSRFHSNSRRP
jgi:hypothetical protein